MEDGGGGTCSVSQIKDVEDRVEVRPGATTEGLWRVLARVANYVYRTLAICPDYQILLYGGSV